MPASQAEFKCVIEDHILKERFSAQVIVRKPSPVRKSLQMGKIDLADVFISPVSGQPTRKVHHHFVVYDFNGQGLYIVRDQQDRDEHRISCNIWDLGQSFARRVMVALKEFA